MFSVIVADIMGRLKENNVKVLTGTKLASITKDGAAAIDMASGEEKLIKADYVVLSLGVVPEKNIADEFSGAFENVIVLGDNERSGRIPHATKDAYLKASVFLSE